MKDKFLSSVSVFDFLAMVVPGGLIMALISHWLEYSWVIKAENVSNKLVVWGYIFVLCYLIGLIHNSLTNNLFCKFKNDSRSIRISLFQTNPSKYIQATLFQDKYYYQDITSKKVFCFPFELLILTFRIIFLKLTALMNEFLKCMECTCELIDKKKYTDSRLIILYFEAYYYGMRHSSHEPITVMERQVVFIRNLLIPILLIELDMIFSNNNILNTLGLSENKCWITILVGVGLISLYITMVSRQNKIYRCVWENYEYLKRLEAKEHESTKQ